tara:strand:- start:16085 stop:19471 length:3387 start_codon:yes stop_codon:yes gene_type:complete
MDKCNIATRALNAIETEAKSFELQTEQYVDSSIEADPEHPRYANSKIAKAIIKIGSKLSFGNKESRAKAINKIMGSLPEREQIANKIRMLIEANQHLALPIVEELHADAISLAPMLKKKVIAINKDTQQRKLLLYKLPIGTLKRYLRFTEAWTSADGSRWDNLWYRGVRLGWGVTRKLRFTENSGAYHKVWKATQDFADNIAGHIHKFMNPTDESIGMTRIMNSVEGVYDHADIDGDLRSAWEAAGFYGGRTKEQGAQRIVELFTWMMHGRVEYVDDKRAAKMTKEKPGRPSRLVYEHGAGWYINQWWAPTSESYDSGDVIFGWQNPVPLRYDPNIHGTVKDNKMTDQKGRLRYDTLDMIMNMPPLTSTMLAQLDQYVQEARVIMDQAFEHFKSQSEESFLRVLNALRTHFPGKSVEQLKRAIVDGKLHDEQGNIIWSHEDISRLAMLENEFTKWSLEQPFKPMMGDMATYKKFYFPYIYMPEKFVFIIEDAIDSMEYALSQIQDAKTAVTGDELVKLEAQEDALKTSIANQKAMKEELLETDEDALDGDKMVTRTRAKHFKHVSNAFDVLKSRTDRGVFRSYLEHTARNIERNNLTAALITAMSMTDMPGVSDAFSSLYKATMGRKDARSLMFGMDLSDQNINPRMVRGLKIYRKFLNLMLSGPTSAIRQAFGNIEKVVKSGLGSFLDASKYYTQNKDALSPMLEESGVTLFNEFFTNSIVKELEAMEMERDNINKMVAEYLSYFDRRNKGTSIKNAENILKKNLTKLWGVKLKWENVLDQEEASQFDAKLRQEKIQRITNKITNFAINNEAILRDMVRENPSMLILAKRGEDIVRNIRKHFGRAGIMSDMEQHIRSISFILGVQNAQKAGEIPSGNMWELTGRDRDLAIYYGRLATNMQFDFSMSRQGVGEAYRGALGSLFSQFSVWKSQKAASDVELWKNALDAVNADNKLSATIKLMFRDIWRNNDVLANSKPEVLRLKRWFLTHFLIEGLMQSMYVLPVLPDVARSAFYLLGARNLGGAGSPIAALIWLPILAAIAMSDDIDDPWDDAKDLERLIAYHIRSLPGAGVGAGFLYDAFALFALIAGNEEDAAKYKAKGMLGYLWPEPVTGAIIKESPALMKKIAN